MFQNIEFILNHIEHHLEHEATAEQPTAPKERLAICLYRMRRGDYYYTIAGMTGHRSRSEYHQQGVQRYCKHLVAQVCDFSRKSRPNVENNF